MIYAAVAFVKRVGRVTYRMRSSSTRLTYGNPATGRPND